MVPNVILQNLVHYKRYTYVGNPILIQSERLDSCTRRTNQVNWQKWVESKLGDRKGGKWLFEYFYRRIFAKLEVSFNGYMGTTSVWKWSFLALGDVTTYFFKFKKKTKLFWGGRCIFYEYLNAWEGNDRQRYLKNQKHVCNTYGLFSRLENTSLSLFE